MKQSLSFIAAILLTLGTTQLATAQEAVALEALQAAQDSDVQQYTFVNAQSTATITVTYFAHNEPNINEYLMGKARVKAALDKVSEYGFLPKIDTLNVFITSKAWSGGDIDIKYGNFYVLATAPTEAIENELLHYCFTISTTIGDITYFSNNNQHIRDFKISNFNKGIALVEKVLLRFAQNGLTLVLPRNLNIGITPIKMSRGYIVSNYGTLYIAITVSEDALERYFMKYLQE